VKLLYYIKKNLNLNLNLDRVRPTEAERGERDDGLDFQSPEAEYTGDRAITPSRLGKIFLLTASSLAFAIVRIIFDPTEGRAYREGKYSLAAFATCFRAVIGIIRTVLSATLQARRLIADTHSKFNPMLFFHAECALDVKRDFRPMLGERKLAVVKLKHE